MEGSKILITVSGTDNIGIAAEFTSVLAEYGVNIKDIKQTLMQDNFLMSMLCDINDSKHSLEEIKKALLSKGKEKEMKIEIQEKL